MVLNPDTPPPHPLGAGAQTPAASDPSSTLADSPLVHAPAWARTQHGWAHGKPLPWLHQEVARRMADRLSVIRLQPQVVLEWDALAGQSRAALQAAYPQALWAPVAATPAALARACSGLGRNAGVIANLGAFARRVFRPRSQDRPGPAKPGSPSSGRAPPAHPQPPAASRRSTTGFLEHDVPQAHGQLLWSNLGLHTHHQPRQVLQRWHACLAIDGCLMFSTWGPDTLRELRQVWDEAGWGPPAQPFRDMHDWGDDLVAAGFADPVMDQESLTLTWADAESALAELRTLGRNAHPARHAGCRTPRWQAVLKAALQRTAGPDGRIALTFEVIYGHAFRPAPRSRMQALTAVSLEDMRHMVQAPRRRI